jgi:hypothetical protein
MSRLYRVYAPLPEPGDREHWKRYASPWPEVAHIKADRVGGAYEARQEYARKHNMDVTDIVAIRINEDGTDYYRRSW